MDYFGMPRKHAHPVYTIRTTATNAFGAPLFERTFLLPVTPCNLCSTGSDKFTAIGDLCAQHTRDVWGVEIRRSSLGPDAGLGVFATRDHRKDALLMPYWGEELTARQLQLRYGPLYACLPYGVHFTNAGVVLESGVQRSLGAMANDARDKKLYNACIVGCTRDASGTLRSSIRATKAIKAGQEIFVPYGCEYWTKYERLRSVGEYETLYKNVLDIPAPN